MLILLKHDTKKYAYDTKSGAAVCLSSLQYRVAENIDFPMTPVCPTALRYQLAKYDSNDVKKAYSYLYELYKAKIIGDEDPSQANILLEGEYAVSSVELGKAIIEAIRDKTGISTKINLLGDTELAQELKNYI